MVGTICNEWWRGGQRLVFMAGTVANQREISITTVVGLFYWLLSTYLSLFLPHQWWTQLEHTFIHIAAVQIHILSLRRERCTMVLLPSCYRICSDAPDLEIIRFPWKRRHLFRRKNVSVYWSRAEVAIFQRALDQLNISCIQDAIWMIMVFIMRGGKDNCLPLVLQHVSCVSCELLYCLAEKMNFLDFSDFCNLSKDHQFHYGCRLPSLLQHLRYSLSPRKHSCLTQGGIKWLWGCCNPAKLHSTTLITSDPIKTISSIYPCYIWCCIAFAARCSWWNTNILDLGRGHYEWPIIWCRKIQYFCPCTMEQLMRLQRQAQL